MTSVEKPITAPDNPNQVARRAIDPAVLLAVWCSMFAYSVLAAPIPAVNEPHYLCKAKHYWQPDWCANDFFLQSSNAHTVFFATVGSLTQWLSFEQTAWIGRVIAIAILALGWCNLLSTLVQCRWLTLHSLWLFLALQSCGNFSGEWLVGGVEGKVFSYGLLFYAFGEIQRGRVVLAGASAGMAIAFHPVIGIWGVLAFVGTAAVEWIWSRLRSSADQSNAVKAMAPRPGIAQVFIAYGAMAVCALPGLIPAIQLLGEPASPQTKAAANFIQVYYRLAHHLDPMRFLPRAYYCYAALLVIWVAAMFLRGRSTSQRRFDTIVTFAVLFALAGIVIGWGPRPAPQMAWYAQRAQLLKFYPFRLADVLVPLAVSIAIVLPLQARLPIVVKHLGYGLLFAMALVQCQVGVDSNRYSGELRTDWIEACGWIDKNLPPDVLVHSPHNGWAFKWFAQRAEYVAFKDCPQDANGIVEWNRRLNFLKRWFEDHYADEFYSADELRDLRRQTKITHILTDRLGPLELQPIYHNESFQVYDLKSLD
ncbi:MAG: hypothetical protein JWP89_5538 [Schlesneria sp.]|nr:hypothetical protein [Schlesneria sp.]